MYIVRNFPTFESTKEYVVDFNSRVTGVFAIARTVEGNYRVEIVNEGAVPANSERRYVMSWVEPTPPPSLETMHKAWESDIDRRATESTVVLHGTTTICH